MNNLCTDIGWMSLNKKGEQLCGDHVDIVPQGENSTVVVLADGMEVSGAELENGLLTIRLTRKRPEMRTRTIPISTAGAKE